MNMSGHPSSVPARPRQRTETDLHLLVIVVIVQPYTVLLQWQHVILLRLDGERDWSEGGCE